MGRGFRDVRRVARATKSTGYRLHGKTPLDRSGTTVKPRLGKNWTIRDKSYRPPQSGREALQRINAKKLMAKSSALHEQGIADAHMASLLGSHPKIARGYKFSAERKMAKAKIFASASEGVPPIGKRLHKLRTSRARRRIV